MALPGVHITHGEVAGLTQKDQLTTATDGTVTWTYPAAYGEGVVPIVSATVQAVDSTTDSLGVQLDGEPTNTQAKFKVTRTVTNSILGINLFSIPASIGAQIIHVEAKAP
mgnify:CR=1 FL=1